MTSTVCFPVGNVTPEGSVVKATAIDPSMLDEEGVYRRTGPTKIFTTERDTIQAIKAGKIEKGDVLVMLSCGPMGTGMEEVAQVTIALKYTDVGKHVALITDARFSGFSSGPCIGHVGPEALAGGPIGKVRDGEMVSTSEIEEIVLLFEGFEHPISIEHLREAWGAKRVKLEEFLAHILRGEELPDWESKVRGEFQSFIGEHTTFNVRQIEMLDALCNYVIANETVAKPDLVKAPFTNYDRLGFRGAFEMDQINEILGFTEALTA